MPPLLFAPAVESKGALALLVVALWGLTGLMLLPLLAAGVLRLIGKRRPSAVVGAFAAGLAVVVGVGVTVFLGDVGARYAPVCAGFAVAGGLVWWRGRRAPLDPPGADGAGSGAGRG